MTHSDICCLTLCALDAPVFPVELRSEQPVSPPQTLMTQMMLLLKMAPLTSYVQYFPFSLQPDLHMLLSFIQSNFQMRRLMKVP